MKNHRFVRASRGSFNINQHNGRTGCDQSRYYYFPIDVVQLGDWLLGQASKSDHTKSRRIQSADGKGSGFPTGKPGKAANQSNSVGTIALDRGQGVAAYAGRLVQPVPGSQAHLWASLRFTYQRCCIIIFSLAHAHGGIAGRKKLHKFSHVGDFIDPA
jgi:hypothetical protein